MPLAVAEPAVAVEACSKGASGLGGVRGLGVVRCLGGARGLVGLRGGGAGRRGHDLSVVPGVPPSLLGPTGGGVQAER